MSFHRILLTSIYILTAISARAGNDESTDFSKRRYAFDHIIKPADDQKLKYYTDCHRRSGYYDNLPDGFWGNVFYFPAMIIGVYERDYQDEKQMLRVYLDGYGVGMITIDSVDVAGGSLAAVAAETCGTTDKKDLYLWRVNEDGIWQPDKKVPECIHDGFQLLKNDPNALAVLQTGHTQLGKQSDTYHIVASPTADTCVTYRCKNGYKATHDLSWEQTKTITPKCEPEVDKCTLYPDNDNRRYRLIENQLFTHKNCDIYGADQSLATLGTIYRKKVKDFMNEQLRKNFDNQDMTPKKLYAIFGDALSFTCSETACTMKDDFDILKDAKGCHFMCKNNEIVMLPFKEEHVLTDICPEFFQMLYNPDEKMELCYYNFDSPNKATEDLLLSLDKQLRNAKESAEKKHDACQNALCTATGGTMNESGACMCGTTKCDSAYTDSNGNTYNYCGIKGEQPKAYCNGTQYIKITNRTQADTANNNKFYQKLNNNGIDSIFEEACPTSNAMSDAGDSQTDIPTLVANLSKIESEFGLSKWRTAEGKFNYARLASDATAGIVLGTTGALVTAHVVKKKQVEDGFESLECTVGGQHVGDWGDVFRIDGK